MASFNVECDVTTLLSVIHLTIGPGGSDSTGSDSIASAGGDVSNVGVIAGGVVGALLAVVVLLILVIVVMSVIKHKENNRGMHALYSKTVCVGPYTQLTLHHQGLIDPKEEEGM